MIQRHVPLLLLGGVILLGTAPTIGQAPDGKLTLLAVSKGQLPTDTGMDDKTVPEIVENFKELGGGKAMKVKFAAGDSVGIKGGQGKNWKQYAFFRVDAFNPGQAPVKLELTVVHARSSSYQTRVVAPIRLTPGKNSVKLGIDELTNVNGSAPDLASVTRWYILDPDSKGPLVYFGDIYLEGGSATPSGTPLTVNPTAPLGPQALVGWHVKGKVGNLDVDLTFTPFPLPSKTPTETKPPVSAVHGDPARLTRIQATRMPKVDKVIEFFTPEADAIVSALEVFPPDNPWNLVVENWPLHPNSKNIVASAGNNKVFRYNPDMGYIIVPPDFKKTDLKVVAYPNESDKGPFPIPDNTPIEGWPRYYQEKFGGKITLDDVQRDKLKENGDRHAIVLDPTNRMLYEFYQLKKVDGGWQAACTAIFDLKSNKMRPEEWTSTDAAGLPLYPAVVRYDELQRGMVEHAMRVTVVHTRRAYVYPARHFASNKTNENLPRMGERLRLRADFDMSGFSPPMQAILKGLKKYGMYVADNGIDWAISVAPDPRMPDLNAEFRKVKGGDFEVVEPPPGYRHPPTE